MTLIRRSLMPGALVASLCAATCPASAQTVVGETPPPSVEVNLDVLNSLSPGTTATGTTYDETVLAPEAATSGSVLLIAPSTGTTEVATSGGSVLMLDQPATTAASDFVFPEVPESKPAVPATGTASADDELAPVAIVAAPEPEPVAEEIVAVETVATVEEVEAAETTQAAADAASTDEAFAQLDDMLAPAVEPEELVEPEPSDLEEVAELAEVAEPAETDDVITLDEIGDGALGEVDVPEPETSMDSAAVAAMAAADAASQSGLDMQILFEPGIDELTDADRDMLRDLAARLGPDGSQRIQLRAYASSTDGEASMARRLSLARALQVRAFLIENNVRSTRIDVRALGDKVEGSGPLDRIDVVLVES